ncbi:MAG: hypothetical protein E7401_03780 [Ruminococcaceae bacterium]|nr:hypothetical protein [Oscillospiraceae bacterium]
MLSNDCKEKCRDIGMLVENIICMAECYDEPLEKFRKSMFYKPEFEDREKIILDMIETSNRVSEEIKLLSVEDLRKLQDEFGIELIGYTDMLATALRKEPYSNNDVKYKCDAIVSIVLDMVHRELRDDAVYQKLAEGVEHENVQV